MIAIVLMKLLKNDLEAEVELCEDVFSNEICNPLDNSKKSFFNPGGISSNLSLWLKDNVAVTISGVGAPALVTDWFDQSGNSHNLTSISGERPEFVNNEINFHNVLDFDGTDDQMTNTSTPLASGVSDELNIFAVSVEQVRQQSALFSLNDGVTTGRILASHPWTNGNTQWFVGDVVVPNRVEGSFSFAVDTPIVSGFYNSVSNSNQEVVTNGITLAQDSDGHSTTSNLIRVGSHQNVPGTVFYFNGQIAEFIVYETDLSATEKQQVQSYLALKIWKLLLDQTTPSAYLASNGTTKMWDETVDAAYTNNIFGIGRDDGSELDQRVSKSVNSDAIITVALDNDFTSTNSSGSRTTTFGSDLQFFNILK